MAMRCLLIEMIGLFMNYAVSGGIICPKFLKCKLSHCKALKKIIHLAR